MHHVGGMCNYKNLHGHSEYYITSRDKQRPGKENRLKATIRHHVVLDSGHVPDCPELRVKE